MRRQTRREMRIRRQARITVDWFAVGFMAGCVMFFFLAVYLVQQLQSM